MPEKQSALSDLLADHEVPSPELVPERYYKPEYSIARLITSSRAVFALGSVLAFSTDHMVLAGLSTVAMLATELDGTYARSHEVDTLHGGILDGLADYSMAAAILALVLTSANNAVFSVSPELSYLTSTAFLGGYLYYSKKILFNNASKDMQRLAKHPIPSNPN